MLFKRIRHVAAGLLMLCAAGASFAQLTIDFSSTHGSGVATNQVLIENVRAYIPVSSPFGGNTTQQADYNVIFQFDPATLHLVPVGITQVGTGATNCSTLKVTVTNAVSGSSGPLAGALVTVAGRTATTDGQGIATLTGLPPGPASVTVAANNYNSASQLATLSCPNSEVAVALSPASGQTGGLTAGQFRVVLNWGLNPSDLDSHLTGPNLNGSRFHVYWDDDASGGLCGLDVDDTSSFGPETVTCPTTNSSGTLRPGVYRYGVHQYSGSSTIGASGATVRLEIGGSTVYSYTPPASGWSGDDDFWTVFELTVFPNGTIGVAPVNAITHHVSSGSVPMAAPATLYGSPESPAVLGNMPRKK